MPTTKTKTKPAAKAATNAVAPRATGAVSVKDMMAKQIASLADKTQPATGNKIRVTQDKQFVLPDGTKTREPLSMVIVDFCSRNLFYSGAYDKDNIQPPACFAIGENPKKLVPSANSPEKQSDDCVDCPNNAWNSAGDGKPGKACKNTRLMAVLPPDAAPGDPMWLLEASPTAIRGFDGYVNGLATRMNLAPFAVVTTVTFDDSKSSRRWCSRTRNRWTIRSRSRTASKKPRRCCTPNRTCPATGSSRRARPFRSSPRRARAPSPPAGDAPWQSASSYSVRRWSPTAACWTACRA